MKTKKIIPALLLLLFFASAYSQSPVDKKNIVKTNLAGYLFRNYNLTYERSLTRWLSLGVSYGNIPKGNIPFSDNIINQDDDSSFYIDDATVSSTQITVEPRFYLGQGYCHGFYFSPYYRQTKMQLDNNTYLVDLNDFNDGEIPLQVSGKTTANSFGLMIGSQWFLGKNNNWVIDWWIAGGHYGTSKGDFDALSDRVLTPQEQLLVKTSLEEELSDLDGIDATVTTNNRGAKINFTGPWAGLRSGLSFGYRF